MRNYQLLVIGMVFLSICNSGRAATKPNILVIVADDLGYADVGFHGCKDIATPHLDALAKRSIRCTSGYVSHPFCSPTRAGLLTGRYQQKFGHENNPAWLPESTVAGLPLSQTTIADVMRNAGYQTSAVGKWHLGAHPQFHPNRRGFDHYFGLLGGGHVYLADAQGGVEYKIPMNRNGRDEPLEGYLTDVLGREASQMIKQQAGQTWFMYLSFNAPHTPLQVTVALMERTKHIQDETRRGYAGLVLGLDDAIGEVRAALKDSGQEDNTIVFFISDNGGPITVTHSENTPLRGAKGQVYEGGVRVPFLVSWPAVLAQGKEYDQPVSSLDIFATAASLAQAEVPRQHSLDGIDLMPFLKGENTNSPHERLYWRTGGGANWAVREGNWKLVKQAEEMALFNLDNDISETKDLAGAHSNIAARLKQAYDQWNKDNIAPLFESPRPGQPKKNRDSAKVSVAK